MDCRSFQEKLPLYLDEKLHGELRHAWRRHLRDCPSCKKKAVEADPSLLFAYLPAEKVDHQGVETCVTTVNSMIRQEKLTRRMYHVPRWWYAAAAAILLSVSTLVFRGLPSASVGLHAGAEISPTATAAREDVQPPRMDLETGPDGVRIYQFADTGDGNSAAYFIVDENLEL